jgi:hypothetical protein
MFGQLTGVGTGLPASIAVSLVPDQDPVEGSRRQAWIQRSMIEFILGIRTPLSTTSMPLSASHLPG